MGLTCAACAKKMPDETEHQLKEGFDESMFEHFQLGPPGSIIDDIDSHGEDDGEEAGEDGEEDGDDGPLLFWLKSVETLLTFGYRLVVAILVLSINIHSHIAGLWVHQGLGSQPQRETIRNT